MTKRIVGVDVARALAVMGMILVNFKMAFGDHGSESLRFFVSLFEGKAAATFVVLAGIGLAFMSNNASRKNELEKRMETRVRLVKRALFLFVVGLLYSTIWIADILHFYGIYMLVALLLISSSKKLIFRTAIGIVSIYPLLMLAWSYDEGWDFNTFEYTDFWSIEGFFRHLFYNGFHPVIPWSAFMLIGLW